LAVGNDGEQIVADSSTSTGLRYTGGTSTGNPVINSALDIWQRGTSFTVPSSSTTYTADRWAVVRNATGMTVSRQAAALTGFNYAIRIQRDSGNTSTLTLDAGYTLESADAIPYAGKTVTVSFYVRAGANYSATSNNLVSYANWGTGTDQRILSGFTGSTNFVYNTTALTTSWQRVTGTGTIGSTATEFGIGFQYTPIGTAGAADYFDVTGLQVDVGSVALPYRRYSATLQGELAACQRYYEKSYDQATAPGTSVLNGVYWSSSSNASATTSYLNAGLRYNVVKRNVPTVTIWDGAGNVNKCTRTTLGVGDNNNQSVTVAQNGNTGANVYSTGTSNTTIFFHYVADSEL
jgi:hypothetical protein